MRGESAPRKHVYGVVMDKQGVSHYMLSNVKYWQGVGDCGHSSMFQLFVYVVPGIARIEDISRLLVAI